MKNKKEEKNKNQKLNKNIIIIGLIVLVLIVVGIVFLILGSGNSKNNNDNKKPEDETEITEEDISNAYGMTKEDAIKKVKQSINSDNFEFSAELNENTKYTVTVKNTITDKIYHYEVDPITGSYYALD